MRVAFRNSELAETAWEASVTQARDSKQLWRESISWTKLVSLTEITYKKNRTLEEFVTVFHETYITYNAVDLNVTYIFSYAPNSWTTTKFERAMKPLER
jgi:hypothetical protein